MARTKSTLSIPLRKWEWQSCIIQAKLKHHGLVIVVKLCIFETPWCIGPFGIATLSKLKVGGKMVRKPRASIFFRRKIILKTIKQAVGLTIACVAGLQFYGGLIWSAGSIFAGAGPARKPSYLYHAPIRIRLFDWSIPSAWKASFKTIDFVNFVMAFASCPTARFVIICTSFRF